MIWRGERLSASGEGILDRGMLRRLTLPSWEDLAFTAGADRKGVESHVVFVVVGIGGGAMSSHVKGVVSSSAMLHLFVEGNTTRRQVKLISCDCCGIGRSRTLVMPLSS